LVTPKGIRSKLLETDFSEILPEDLEEELKDTARLSMGSDVTPTDEQCIKNLANQILELNEYKESLGEYLKSRMQAIAPNTSFLIGE
jgi:nucleolar protein 58